MDVRLIISASENLILSFLLKERKVSEIKVEQRSKKRLVGSIFKGRVRRVVKSLNGVFLDIGLDKEAFLLIKNPGREECALPKAGTELLVQMKREPIDEKGAKVTCKISIPGKYLVYFPTTKKLMFSSKIEDERDKDRFKNLLGKALNGEGVIVRTCAKFASDEEILEELQKLRNTWEDINRKARSIKVGMVYGEIPLYAQLIRDYWNDISEIVVDDIDLWTELLSYIEKNFKNLLDKVRYVKSISTFLKRYDIDKTLTQLFTRYVWLKSGGYIIIEETQTLTVIDVNSGSGHGNNLEENALRTNLEAAEEIARQIKLRDIGGIIIIDFIDMKDKKHREMIKERVKELFADEGSRVHIYGITHLGLLEMTRKKESPSITKLLSDECPHCRGKGYVKSLELVLYEIEKELAYNRGKYMEVRVNPALKNRVESLVKNKGFDKWVSVREENNVPLDYYEMKLV